ncbi:MAG: 16S rRNA (cytosine(1402)-N(4))-methyltransferase RsmH [Candidatus Omnitrophica bacterium]|nr:16S rRNA (cytosine(1402)-N(4))-methyltransferase RsmH [Candidatus Omnitrophota bacterium]
MHKTVFLKEAVDHLSLKVGDTVVDATFGNGGHTREILERVGPSGVVVAIDQDPHAVERMRELQKTFFNIRPIHGNFRALDTILAEGGIECVDAVLFDVGLSQNLLEESERGFSFRKDEPLDMRMDPTTAIRAYDIVNTYPEHEIADIIYQFGEERRSRRIARAIVNERRSQRIKTSGVLSELIMKISSGRERSAKLHPATRTFQALRIYVNDELAALEEGLTKAIAVLKPGGRCVVIAFHSLEDRIAKLLFRKEANHNTVRLVTKKPLTVSQEERITNPRARSAKMRVIEKRI